MPRFSPWKWGRLFKALEEHPDDLVAVVQWIERERVPRRLVRDVAQVVGPYVESGGKLEDLLVGGDFPDSPYDMMKRMLGMADGYLDRNPLPEEVRERTLVVIGRLLEAL